MKTVTIGILACQGAFAEHISHLERVRMERGLSEEDLLLVEVRLGQQVQSLDGLIIPGGESTTMSRFLERNDLVEPIKKWMTQCSDYYMPTWGTCAGMILLSNRVKHTKQDGQRLIGGMDITCDRNSFGRQKESHEALVDITDPDLSKASQDDVENSPFLGIFIRAPGVMSIDSTSIRVLGRHSECLTPVAVRQNNLLATSFHPELGPDTRWHSYFLDMVLQISRHQGRENHFA